MPSNGLATTLPPNCLAFPAELTMDGLEAAEDELESEETILAARRQQARRQTDAIKERLLVLEQRSSELAGKSAAPEARDFAARLSALSNRPCDVDSMLNTAAKARWHAVRARRKAHQETSLGLQAFAREFHRLTQDVAAYERRLAALDAHLRSQPRPSPTAQGASLLPEQRVYPRARMHAAVTLCSEDNFYRGFSTDISSGGIFIATFEQPPMGTPVEVSFSLPGGAQFCLRGEVHWHRDYNDATPFIFPGVGVQFLEMTTETRVVIDSFIAAREPIFFTD